ncbi:MAG: hypothetical protein NC209_05460 [Alistipes sp.]|nr:hypothetical protein [Alistipes senegalensis]MCM1250572.1 hypothetical protein [Alistipes sp.]
MEKAPENYSRKGWMAAAALLGVLVGVSFIPPQSIGSVEIRRANILSDLVEFDDTPAPQAAPSAVFDEEEFQVDMAEVAELIEADTVPPRVQTLYEWTVGRDTVGRAAIRPDTTLRHRRIVPIEEYDTARSDGMRAFYDTLLTARRPVRIAVLGDSFIEGDILTADLRERLQETYGGGGTGFAPMASPLTAFRRTVKTASKGWTSYNIMQRKKTPESLRDKFYVSGWVCQPAEGASTRWEATSYRRRLDACTCGRIFFLSPDSSRIEITLNDTLRHEFAVDGDPAVRQIAVRAPRIGSLAFRVMSGTRGFIGYGAVMEGDGISVDNYSIRSNNGQAMFWTNPSIDAQIDAMLDYDLVILQYGLNIMQAGVYNYTNYAAKIEKMVSFVRECFPGAAVLVMGVSDRAVRGENGVRPMNSVPYMTLHQRQAARRAEAAFWATSDAMRSLGGMERFVRNGWAGKDHTHINYAGGTRIAQALFEALDEKIRAAYEAQRNRQPAEKPDIMDSLRMERFRRQLLFRTDPLEPTLP